MMMKISEIKEVKKEISGEAVVRQEQAGDDVLIDDTLALAQQAAGVDGKVEELRARIASEHKKIITVTALLPEENKAISELLGMLADLKREVFEKKDAALAQSGFIKQKVDNLVSSGKVQIDEEEYTRSAVSVAQYAGLLDNIVGEIDRESHFFSLFLGQEIPAHIVAWTFEPDDFNQYMKAKIRYVRKYIKNIRKDLNVSFSRYVIGFNAQIDRILQVETFIRYHDRQQQAVSAQQTSK